MSEEVAIDPTLLKVRGNKNFDGNRQMAKGYISDLSSAILTVISKHGSAKLKCVGVGALGNAYKAFCVAREEAGKKGIDLVDRGSFGSADFGGTEKPAMIMHIQGI